MVNSRFLAIAVVLLATSSLAAQEPVSFNIQHARDAALNGRLFVIVSKKEIGPGIFSQSWFTPEPFFAQDVKSWPANQPLALQPTASFPGPLADLKPGPYFVQAIFDHSHSLGAPLASPGNLFSKAQKIDLDPKKPVSVALVLDRVVPAKEFKETATVKLFERECPSLKTFAAGRDDVVTRLRAGVVLPKSFAANPQRRYPIVYEIPGFGGDHHMAFKAEGRDSGGVEMIHVMLDPVCRLGHHVFADSANNGPLGQALVTEFLPALEKAFRGSGQRFVTGHSSGGWSSLWLQITYPEIFDGVWSTAPDAVDFRDFQLVDIYEKNANLLFDPQGALRPLARKEGKTVLTYQQFSDMETVLGRGGQLGSFEAVFSARGPDGKPRPLWNRTTGAIDAAVAQSWRAYDIRQLLEKDWPAFAPKLAGKIHIVMGAEDTFFLDGATRLLKESLHKLGSDAVIEIVPGKHHGNLVDAALRQRIGREMAARTK